MGHRTGRPSGLILEDDMTLVYHRTKRGASQGYYFASPLAAERHLRKLCRRHVKAIAKNEAGDVVGRVWFDDGNNHWNWFMEQIYLA